ncbi:DUF3558 family protein [Nocardia terpenica]|uniref:DUF3558 domain-containing protein n=1 Tax=Nocardia terpenica TaxID=455432 RepID=A0A6G9YY02_9NOCA|nr:DUF3558 family protein [Nocardia terpenica]QIS18205.1 DUF3558 domain-containing protein [Nocardia terpenica]
MNSERTRAHRWSRVRRATDRNIAEAAFIALVIVLAAACGNSGKSQNSAVTQPPPLPDGVDLCHTIPPDLLKTWNIDPNPSIDPNEGGDGISSPETETKGCTYQAHNSHPKPEDATKFPVGIQMTTITLDDFRTQMGKNVPYHETVVDGRKAGVMGPYGSDYCVIHVVTKFGGVRVSTSGPPDPCQFVTDFAKAIVPLLPPGN